MWCHDGLSLTLLCHCHPQSHLEGAAWGRPSLLEAHVSVSTCLGELNSGLLSALEQLLSDTRGETRSDSGTEASLRTQGGVLTVGCWCWVRHGPVHVYLSDGPCRLHSSWAERLMF